MEKPVFAASTTSLLERVGDERVDCLLGGQKWGGPSDDAVVLTYSFPRSPGDYQARYGAYDEPHSGFSGLSAVQQDAVRAALQLWSNLAQVQFVEVNEGIEGEAQLRFAHTDASPTAHAYFPSAASTGGDVWLGPLFGATANYDPGSYFFQSLVHEIGHALGLKHPHEELIAGIVAPAHSDWLGNSVMSYRSFPADNRGCYTSDFYPTTPMNNDILAIQSIYGANTTFNSGDTEYRWGAGERLFETIYDAGGTDLIDWSNQHLAARIDLRPGAWSNLGQPYSWQGGKVATTLRIADGTLIENARGGAGNDTIHGNDADNMLAGDGGKDKLFGGDGDDRLEGGSGNDRIDGGDGFDTVIICGNSEDFSLKISKSKVLIADTSAHDAGLGRDKLCHIEALAFDDVLVTIPGKEVGAKIGWTSAADMPDLLDHLVPHDIAAA